MDSLIYSVIHVGDGKKVGSIKTPNGVLNFNPIFFEQNHVYKIDIFNDMSFTVWKLEAEGVPISAIN